VLGERLIQQEADLDRLFASRTVTRASLSAATSTIGATQAALREAHLRFHLATVEVLTPNRLLATTRLGATIVERAFLLARCSALLVIAFTAAFTTSSLAQDRSIVVASTTSTQDSGLFGHILPRSWRRPASSVKIVAQGTGQALDTARRAMPMLSPAHGLTNLLFYVQVRPRAPAVCHRRQARVGSVGRGRARRPAINRFGLG
jgi:hypothetical protein